MNRLYATDEAPRNWLALMEELRVTPGIGHAGTIELHVTNGRLRRSDRSEDGEYPPVYKIVYVPLSWDNITKEQIVTLFGVGEVHGAKVKLSGRDGKFIAVFESR